MTTITSITDGGPAFPFTEYDHMTNQPCAQWHGVSVRDLFAGLALIGIISRDGAVGTNPTLSATQAYHFADSMLKVRK